MLRPVLWIVIILAGIAGGVDIVNFFTKQSASLPFSPWIGVGLILVAISCFIIQRGIGQKVRTDSRQGPYDPDGSLPRVRRK